jgi:hypothetical protein
MDSEGKMRETIEAAREQYRCWVGRILEDPRLIAMLADLDQAIGRSREAMLEAGVFGACRICDEEEGGSCCGAGIESRYGPDLLLVNLLLGEDLVDDRAMSNSCFFLGNCGCTLKVRHTLCVNYLCSRIQEMLELSDLIHLQEVLGEEMDRQFFVCEAVKQFMAKGAAGLSKGTPADMGGTL